MPKGHLRGWFAKVIKSSLARAKRASKLMDAAHDRYVAAQDQADRFKVKRDEAREFRKATLAFIAEKLNEAESEGVKLPKLEAIWREMRNQG